MTIRVTPFLSDQESQMAYPPLVTFRSPDLFEHLKLDSTMKKAKWRLNGPGV